MSKRRFRKLSVLAKIETGYGTDSTPTGAANGVQMKNVTFTPLEAEEVAVDAKNILKLQEGSYIRITVKDSGSGIPKEDLPRIFDPYFTTKKPEARQGLGLPICESLLKHYKGGIAVESAWGKGAAFHLYRPVDNEPVE